MFTGFLRETPAFFTALRFNNTRAFFEENRELYARAVRDPLTALASALAPVVHEIDPQLDTRPERAVSRIYRDVRFRKDKTPYRDYMWVGFRRVGEAREETCGFYFDLSDTAAHWGCGYYQMIPETMARLRETILETPAKVLSILEAPDFARDFALEGERYLRANLPPQGLPEPLCTLYQKKNVYAEHLLDDWELLFRPELAERIADGFRALAPFYDLLRGCMVKKAGEVRP